MCLLVALLICLLHWFIATAVNRVYKSVDGRKPEQFFFCLPFPLFVRSCLVMKGWMLSETYVVLMACWGVWGEFGMQREQAFKLIYK